MKVLLGIQCRSASKRFPKKYKEKIGEKSLLQWIWDAAENVKVFPKILDHIPMVLMPEGDEELAKYCQKEGMEWFQPTNCEENDVLTRYIQACNEFDAELVVRLTADCWRASTWLIEQCIAAVMDVDYCSNTIFRSYPEGLDVQACSKNALKWFDMHSEEREHPFADFDANAKMRTDFTLAGLTWRPLVNQENPIFHKTSIDTVQDLERARKAYEHQVKST